MAVNSLRIKELELELRNLQKVKKKLEEEVERNETSLATNRSTIYNEDITDETCEGQLRFLRTHLETQELLHKMTVFRFIGLTVLDQSNEKVTLRLESTYNGRYFGHYIVQLERDRMEWDVKSHTLPHFIPLRKILEDCGTNDVKQIVKEIQTYLDAYSCRLAQVKAVQETYGTFVSITALASYEFVSFYFTVGPRYLTEATFLLTYGLRDEVPTEVSIDSSKYRLRFYEIKNRLKEREIANCIKYAIRHLF